MRSSVRAVLAILLLLAGCVPRVYETAPEVELFRSPVPVSRGDPHKLILLPPDLSEHELFFTSLGVHTRQLRTDWTEEATRNVIAALEAKFSGRARVERLDEANLELTERALYERFVTLARAVRDTVGRHVDIPTQMEPFRYFSVGETGRWLAESHDARYAFSLGMMESHLSLGSYLANEILTTLMSAVGRPTTPPILREHVGAAILIDLESGQVVWHNRIAAHFYDWTVTTEWHPDLRTPTGANRAIEALLKELPL